MKKKKFYQSPQLRVIACQMGHQLLDTSGSNERTERYKEYSPSQPYDDDYFEEGYEDGYSDVN